MIERVRAIFPSPRLPPLLTDWRPRLVGQPRNRAIVEVVLFMLLSVIVTWPLAIHFTDSLPIGTESCATVPLFNLWTIGWNVDHFGFYGRGYWNAPIFHPTPEAFAFSEPFLLAGAAATPIWWVSTPAAAYNFLLLVSLILNGWATCRLLQALRLRWLPALLGGAMLEWLPFIHWQLGVFQLVPLFGIVWTLHALLRISQRPGIGHGLLLGLALAVSYLLCSHYGIFLAMLLVLCGWVILLRHVLRWQMWCGLLMGASLASLLVWPEVSVQRRMAREHEFTRTRQQVENLSASISYYTTTPWRELFPLPDLREGAGKFWMLSPGTTKYCLALLGLLAGLWHRRRRGFTVLCAVMLVLSVALSLGPKLAIDGWHPYDWLREYVPGFVQVRNMFRFAVIAQVMVVILATIGLQALIVHGRRRESLPERGLSFKRLPRLLLFVVRHPTSRALLVATIGIVAVSEVRPPVQKLFELPSRTKNYHWITWVKNATPPETVLAHLPFPQGTWAEHYQPTTVAMYWQLWHHRPLVNGYSGFFPESFLELKDEVNKLPTQLHGLDLLRQHGVRYCVVDRTWMTREQFKSTPALRGQLEWVRGDDDAGLDVYELVPRLEKTENR